MSKDSNIPASELENSLARSIRHPRALILQKFGNPRSISRCIPSRRIFFKVWGTWDYSRLFIIHVRRTRRIPKSERYNFAPLYKKYSRESRNYHNYRPRENRESTTSRPLSLLSIANPFSRASRHTNCTDNYTRPRSINILLCRTHQRKLNCTLNLIS